MLTLLGALMGFLSSMVPEIISFYKDKADRRHELEILSMQLKQQRLKRAERLDEVQAYADIAESRALYRTYNTGVKWVDALNGTVRPVLAYAFFVLYATVKCISVVNASTNGFFYHLFWTEEDAAIFASIISFYFGQRALSKLRR